MRYYWNNFWIKGVNTLATQSRENMQDEVYPTPEDTAIVMYTSGSTGTPKVFVSNENNIQLLRFYLAIINIQFLEYLHF